MKVSELIWELQNDLAVFGDNEVVFSCDDLDEEIPISAIGYLTDKDGKHFTMIICAECAYQSSIEKHMFDDEPEAWYPDDDDLSEHPDEDWP